MKKYTDKQILNKVKSLPSFKYIPSNRWIVVIRSEKDNPDEYDDKLYQFEGEEFINVMSCTSNPGIEALKKGYLKYNKLGAAIIKSDECYYDSYKFGYHNSKMPALRQVKNIKYYRDNNNDLKTDEEGEIYEDNFNTNIHSNTYKYWDVKSKEEFIKAWSYGCIVVNDRIRYKSMVDYYEETKNYVSLVVLKEF